MINLKGLRVLNTRPAGQAANALTKAVKLAGGIAIEFPALVIESSNLNWLNTLPDLATATKAIFTSTNAVDYCFASLIAANKLWPPTIEVIAIGKATAEALKKQGIQVSLIPEQADSEHLLTLLAGQVLREKTILLFKGEGGRTLIAETLLEHGAKLLSFEVYRRVMPQVNQQVLQRLWQNTEVDIILLTSVDVMNNLFSLFGPEAHDWLCNKPCLVISERLAKEAALLGIKTIIVSSPNQLLYGLHQFNQGLIHGNEQ